MDDITLKRRISLLCQKHEICPTIAVTLASYNRGKFNDYHNSEHMLHVAERCDDAMHHPDHKHMLGTPEAKALIISALLHDIHHSGGFSSELINIGRAINAAAKYLRCMSYNDLISDMVIENIWCTTYYDGCFPHEPKNEAQMILRDADLMQLFRQFGNHIRFGTGLIGELRRAGVIGQCESWIQIEDFLRRNDDFLNKQKFFTNWGKEQLEIHMNTV